MTIRTKLLVFGIAIVAIPLTIIGFTIYNITSDSFKEISKEAIGRIADQTKKIVSKSIENEVNLLHDISIGHTAYSFADALKENPDIPNKDIIALMNSRLKKFRDEMGNKYEAVSLVNKKGLVISDSFGGKLLNLNVNDREYFKKTISGEISVGQIVVSKATGDYVVVASIPFKTKTDEIVGVLSGIIKLSAVTDYIKNVTIGNTGYVYIVDPNTKVLAHPDQSVIMKMTMSKLEGLELISQKILNKESGVEEYVLNGVPKIAGFSHMDLTNWNVISTQNEADFLSAVYGVRNMILLIGGIFVVISGVLVVIFARSISKPLSKAMEMSDFVSSGDFTKRLKLKRKDEFGAFSRSLDNMADNLETKAHLAKNIASGNLRENVVMASENDTLGEALKNMVDHLNTVIYRIRNASDQVMSGSQQVSDSSQSLSQGATEQAASMEEITSSMTQIASQVKQNAENASQCEGLAKDSQINADQGNREMQNMIMAMTEISDSSMEIEKIIKAIDEIAFQTNLLALNAAVEAARAGKHGKGFAVVAEEVRNLAARSAKAAKETAELIEGSVKKVEVGMDIAEKTADSLSKIVESGAKVSALVGEIATACNDQAQGISQINQGLTQMDQVTQTNTANAEETASASEELSGQAIELQQLISNFKLKDRNVAVGYKPGGRTQEISMDDGSDADFETQFQSKRRLTSDRNHMGDDDSNDSWGRPGF